MSVEVSASSSQITATASGSTVAAAVGTTTVSASSSGGIGPQGPTGPQGDQGEPGEGGGGDFLPLAGGTMTGNIVFDETGGQFIGKGLVDTERGGSYGISLVCSVGYQFNWQAGWVLATEQDGTTPRPLYLDGAAGTTLRVWDAAENEGVEIAHDGITFADDTTQTTAWTGTVSYDDLDDLPTLFSGAYADLSGLPTLFDGAYTSLTSVPSTFAPAAHKSSHATGGSDALTAADVGAAASSHSHSWSDITSGIPSTFTPTSHTHGLGDLTQGGATTGQVIAWSGSAWAPATVSSGSSSASDLTSGTLADARLSDKARAADNLYLWSNFR